LQPLYARVFKEAYLPAGNEKLMFFEPAQIPDTFLPSGFTELPGGANYSHLQVLNDHSYGPCALGDLNASLYPICKAYHEVKVS